MSETNGIKRSSKWSGDLFEYSPTSQMFEKIKKENPSSNKLLAKDESLMQQVHLFASSLPGNVEALMTQDGMVTEFRRMLVGFRFDGVKPTPVGPSSYKLHDDVNKAAREVRIACDPPNLEDRADVTQAAQVINAYRNKLVDLFAHYLQGLVNKRLALAKCVMIVLRSMGGDLSLIHI